MDILRVFQNVKWFAPEWSFPSTSKETNQLLLQCVNLPTLQLTNDVDEIIKKSKAFPIPFPIDTVRLEKLKERRPVERLKRNIISTYTLIHERVLLLITHFLIYKREFGSDIEKALYKDMTVIEFIERLLRKRSISFLGKNDKYLLISGEKGSNGWEQVGTLEQKPPLILENCLIYDEMKLSAMVYVSGYTECINDGLRRNVGQVKEDNIEENAVIIGLIGPRFKRIGKMDYEDIIFTKRQNCSENGYGKSEKSKNLDRHKYRQMWSEFYQVPNYTYQELPSYINVQKDKKRHYMDRYVKNAKTEEIFDNEIYYKRIAIITECTLIEAEARAKECGKNAFVNVIGCGLGVWKISPHQLDAYILIFLERIRFLLKKDLLNHVTDVNFAYIKPNKNIEALFTNSSQSGSTVAKKMFLASKTHPEGGINVQLESREPSSKLTGKHAGKLLVMTYPWDGNAHPGNEFWLKKLSSSGDPAAACSTQVSELHNAYINPAVSGHNVRVIGRDGLKPLSEYCADLTS